MNAIKRNLGVLGAGVASIGAGYGYGYEMSQAPTSSHRQVAKYVICGTELKASEPNMDLPGACDGLVVYARPEQHHDETYPTSYSLRAENYRLDRRGLQAAQMAVAQETALGEQLSIGGGVFLWGVMTSLVLSLGAERRNQAQA